MLHKSVNNFLYEDFLLSQFLHALNVLFSHLAEVPVDQVLLSYSSLILCVCMYVCMYVYVCMCVAGGSAYIALIHTPIIAHLPLRSPPPVSGAE